MDKRLFLVLLLLLGACDQATDTTVEAELSEPAAQPQQEPEPLAQEPAETPIEQPIEEETPEAPVPQAQESFQLIQPRLTYPGAYNGPLFDTSLQIGDSGDLEKYFENFDRNGMNFFIGYFSLDMPPTQESLHNQRGLGFLLDAVQKHPGRIVPYFSLSTPPEDIKKVYGSEFGRKWSAQFRQTLEASTGIAGQEIIRGFGEVEQFDFGALPNDKNLLMLYDIAAEKGVNVMFHPNDAEYDEVEDLLKRYPDTVFLIHMFRTDMMADRAKYIDLLRRYDNLYFSIDADHMMFSTNLKTGLLYAYEFKTVPEAKRLFLSDYAGEKEVLLAKAVQDYRPLIEAAPDKVMWGTEMGRAYTFEPEVYDKIIEFSRLFIGQLKPEHQEAFAYKNAQRVFGEGARMRVPVSVPDVTSWPECSKAQMEDCASEGDACGSMDSVNFIQCEASCHDEKRCLAVFEESS